MIHNLSAEHYRMLSVDSAITDEVINARGYYTETMKVNLEQLGFGRSQQCTPSLVLPLFKPNGQNGLYQIRPDHPRIKNGKALKYEFPSGARVHLDVTPLPWVFEAMRNPALPFLFTEGTKKIDAAASRGLAGVAAIGVWNWRGTNDEGGKMLLADFEDIALNGRNVFIVFDSDVMVKPAVWTAMDRLAHVLKNRGAQVRYIYLPSGEGGVKTGLDDWFARGGTRDELLSMAVSELRPCPVTVNHIGDNDSDQAEGLSITLKDRYAWDETASSWMAYEAEMEGVWRPIPLTRMHGIVGRELKAKLHVGQSKARIQNVEYLMRHHCTRQFNAEPRNLLPLANGVLDIDYRELLPHHPDHGFTWALPYAYDPEADCPKGKAWLREAMQGNAELVEVLRAYLRATILGRADLQVFLEAYGPGGSGKGTYTRLAQALVGFNNTKATSFQRLADNRFETTSLYGKRLVLITEAEARARGIELFKAITGGDSIPYERKNRDAQTDFVFSGMVIISGNQRFSSLDNTSGLARRRLTVHFGHQPKNRRQLLEFHEGQPVGELVDELPGVLNWVLSMNENVMRRLLFPYGRGEQSLAQEQLHSLVETNTFAAWAEESLIHDPKARTRVGKFIKPDRYSSVEVAEHEEVHLYPNYCRFCTQTRREKPIALNKFSESLIELATVQLQYTDVGKETDSHTGAAFIRGVRLRQHTDVDAPRFVTDVKWEAEPSTQADVWEPEEGEYATFFDQWGNVEVCEWVNGEWVLDEKLTAEEEARQLEGCIEQDEDGNVYIWRNGQQELVASAN